MLSSSEGRDGFDSPFVTHVLWKVLDNPHLARKAGA